MDRGDLTGAVLDGRYRVIEPVASGAMGVVYKAERVKLGRVVAVKVLHDQLPESLAGRRRFEIEAMAMAKLEHPHCAAVLDVGLHDGVPFVVMDFVSGTNLKDVIEGGPLPPPRAVEIVRQVLSGLAHAHELGIIHRDIKPANIVLGQKAGLGDHVTILDFGLARFHQSSSKLTTNIVVGTPAYMAPEQIRGDKLDTRVDVYACGVLLFELLTGHKPYHSETDDPVEVCKMHLGSPIPRLDETLVGRDFGALEDVVRRALAKDAAERYPSAVDFAHALASALSGSNEPATEPVPRSEPESVGTIGSMPPMASGGFFAGEASTVTARARTAPPEPAQLGALFERAPSPPPELVPASQLALVPAPRLAPQVPATRVLTSSHRRAFVIAGALFVGASIAIGALVVHRRGAQSHYTTIIPPPPPPAPPAPPDEVPEVVAPAPAPEVPGEPPIALATARPAGPGSAAIARAQKALDGGDRTAARAELDRARRKRPDDADLAYALGLVDFAKGANALGLRSFRAALNLDPTYRTEPALIRAAVHALVSAPAADPEISRFLRDDIGSIAAPFLAEASLSATSAQARDRASAELRAYL